jgi:hypothetical protein
MMPLEALQPHITLPQEEVRENRKYIYLYHYFSMFIYMIMNLLLPIELH